LSVCIGKIKENYIMHASETCKNYMLYSSKVHC